MYPIVGQLQFRWKFVFCSSEGVLKNWCIWHQTWDNSAYSFYKIYWRLKQNVWLVLSCVVTLSTTFVSPFLAYLDSQIIFRLSVIEPSHAWAITNQAASDKNEWTCGHRVTCTDSSFYRVFGEAGRENELLSFWKKAFSNAASFRRKVISPMSWKTTSSRVLCAET